MRALFWACAKRVLFLLEAERAHRFMVGTIHLLLRLRARAILSIASGTSVRGLPEASPPAVFGMTFLSRVGLAAGFDKDAEILEALPALGFGFAEIGTVTPRPQPGNEKPRLLRDPRRKALFNRMGFNGLGAAVVSARLELARKNLPPSFRVGVNLGKNKDTTLEDAHRDYEAAARYFQGLADYIVINVSSPNTPGLRSLQATEALKPIVGSVQGVISRWGTRPPLLLKLAPELEGEDLEGIIKSVEDFGVDGWVLTNTLGGAIDLEAGSTEPSRRLSGGWSGGVLTERARKSLIQARRVSRLPIISVGGIMTPEEAVARRRDGAELVQIYSGWVYGGPGFPREVDAALRQGV